MRQALIRAIAGNVTEVEPRREYVDWCFENALPKRATYIAAALALEQHGADEWFLFPGGGKLFLQVAAHRENLLRWAEEEGLPPLLAPRARYRRGFAECFTADTAEELRQVKGVAESYPVACLTTKGSLARLHRMGLLATLPELYVDRLGSLEWVTRSVARNLPMRTLSIGERVALDLLERLSEVKALESLTLPLGELDATELKAISGLRRISCAVRNFSGPKISFPFLREFHLRVDVEEKGFPLLSETLQSAPALSSMAVEAVPKRFLGRPYELPRRFIECLPRLPLDTLCLPWGVRNGVQALAGAGALDGLGSLEVSLHPDDEAAAVQIECLFSQCLCIESMGFDLLSYGSPMPSRIRPATVKSFSAKGLPDLRRLRLNTELVHVDGLNAWCASLPQLVRLELVNRRDARPTFEALCRGPVLDRLAYLQLIGSNLPRDAASRLSRVHSKALVMVKRTDE